MNSLNKQFVFLGFFLLLVNFGFCTDTTTKSKMKADLDFIYNSFDVYYAPKEWKKEYSGWNLESEIQKAKNNLDHALNLNTKKFQEILKGFFQSTQDYHVDIYFHSTEAATLPLIIQGVEDRYFILTMDKAQLPFEAASLQPGDEVLSFDDQPIDNIIKELIELYGAIGEEKSVALVARG